MAFPLMAIPAIAQGVGGLIGGIVGAGQRRQARRMLRSLKRPTYAIPQEILRSQKTAEISAQEGMPSAQYNAAMQNIARQQNAALQAATDRRLGLGAIAASQQAATDATLNLDVADAQQRLQNQQTLYNVSGQTAGYRDKAFDINQMQPYLQNYQYAQSLLGAGNQNIMGGIDRVLGAGTNLFGTGLFGSGAGGQRSMTGGNIQSPIYYGGKKPTYADFETEFEY